MSEPSPYEPILKLLGVDSSEQNAAKEQAKNVHAGLELIRQKLRDLDSEILKWKDLWAYGNASPIGILFRAQKAGDYVGVDVPGPTPEDVIRFFRGNLLAVSQNVQRAEDMLEPYLNEPGDPQRIRQVAAAWSDQVQGPISGLIGWFSADTLLVDDGWTGAAATAYGKFYPGQQKAVIEVQTRAKILASDLNNLAREQTRFWNNVGQQVSAAVTRIGALSASLLSKDIIDLPKKAGVIVDELNKMISSFIKELDDALDVYNRQATKLLTMRNNNEYFPGERWPRPAAIGGISVDPSDWTPVETD